MSDGPRLAGASPYAKNQPKGATLPNGMLKDVHYFPHLIGTPEPTPWHKVAELMQTNGWQVNGFQNDPSKLVVTFDNGDDLSVDKTGWPMHPFIRSSGPSVQVEREAITEKPPGCCGGEYSGPKATRLAVSYRPADYPHQGSQLYQRFVHEGELAMMTKPCCWCCFQPMPVNDWMFTNAEGATINFKRIATIVMEESEEGGGKKPVNVLPEKGLIWSLQRNGETIASLEIPGGFKQVPKCGGLCGKKWVPENPAEFNVTTICCETRYTQKNPKMWMRVFKPDGSTMYAIRNQKRPEDMPANPGCCSPLACNYCCKQTCPEGCYSACAPCCGFYMIACGPAPRMPIFAQHDGVITENKKKGQRIKREVDPVYKIGDPDEPAHGAEPAQEKMMVFKYPALPASGGIAGKQKRQPTLVDFMGRDKWGKVVVDTMKFKTGDGVRKGDIVGYAKVKVQCCSIPNCYCGDSCPVDNPCCAQPCEKWPGCEKCAGCIIHSKLCCKCQSPMCSCCPCCNPMEVPLEYYDLPVTGEWANTEKEPYRVRAEVFAEGAMSLDSEMHTVANVMAGLEEGTPEQDHWGFAIINFMELFQDHRRPNFHEEHDPKPDPSKGLPPRQLSMKFYREESEDDAQIDETEDLQALSP